ncbi:hypothetical protein [Ramlibacter sp.]|uniref:hypothetical protein n=1 Tax=Ramlibacter sp. TaxID=1917967 RepID=UPI003D0B323F
MKFKLGLVAALCVVASASFAQAPPGTQTRPSQQTDPLKSGGAPQAKAGMTAEANAAASPMSANAPTAMGHKAMDANGDGMVSQKEWDAYHRKAWTRMKRDKKGMAAWSDVEAMMKGGPN